MTTRPLDLAKVRFSARDAQPASSHRTNRQIVKNAAPEEEIAAASAAESDSSLSDQIAALKQLHVDGTLSAAEFQQAKSRLLGS